ncbi:tumor protein p63-regulated gene 1-like protein [Petromyzon marinus]|uniref:tumor protein p63-regulated gene 1-like protein n=1 Tax=Petromyzon marinus TaxID=7757 RepID=UPI003F7285FA
MSGSGPPQLRTPELDIDLGSDSELTGPPCRGLLEAEEPPFHASSLRLAITDPEGEPERSPWRGGAGVLGVPCGPRGTVVSTVTRLRVETITPGPRTAAKEAKVKHFFVFRPGSLEQAVSDVKALMSPVEDGEMQSVWLLTEVDHWNTERERLVLLAERSMLVCKYDFMSLHCRRVRRIPLRYVETVTTGAFLFPHKSLSKREGLGVRVEWDRVAHAPFWTQWNPFSEELPYTTFTQHPMASADEKIAALCQIASFQTQLVQAVQLAQRGGGGGGGSRAPGEVGVEVCATLAVQDAPLRIDTYVGLVSLIGNEARLGYSMARGLFGF